MEEFFIKAAFWLNVIYKFNYDITKETVMPTQSAKKNENCVSKQK
jgi:hypothetical protein